jgi:hypothetical protein
VTGLVDASNARIQGNYLLHDYHGGFSQGFNLWLQGTSGSELAEHNVVIGGSWPIQSFGGEFRYNLVVDSGHNFWRSAADDTRIHHNLFVHATGTNTGYNGAILVYGGESGLDIFNNTFDAGGAVSDLDAPAFTIGAGSLFRSIRNNLFTAFSDVSATYGKAFVSADGGAVSAPRVTSADYNGWYNPLASSSARYLPGIAQGTPGAHDVQADPKLSGKPEIPFAVPQGCVWLGTYTTGHVLARYRHLYLVRSSGRAIRRTASGRSSARSARMDRARISSGASCPDGEARYGVPGRFRAGRGGAPSATTPADSPAPTRTRWWPWARTTCSH